VLANDFASGLLRELRNCGLESVLTDDSRYRVYPGYRAFRERRFEESLSLLAEDRRGAESREDDALYLELVRGVCLLQLQRYHEAVAVLFSLWTRRAEIRSFDALMIQFNLALVYHEMRMSDKALSHLEYVERECPRENRTMLGRVYRLMSACYRQIDPARAREMSQRSLEVLSPEEGGSMQQVERLGLVFDEGDYDRFFELLGEIDREAIPPQQRLRCELYELLVLFRQNRHAEVIECYRRMRESGILRQEDRAPGVDLYAVVGISHQTLGQAGEADRFFRKAWEIYSRTGQIHNRELLEFMEDRLDDHRLEDLPFEQLSEFGIIGISPPMQKLKQQLARIQPGNLPVLITGETGTGKELVARSFAQDGRPFVAVNCRAAPTTLISSLLFGHAKGAFTGAHLPSGGWVEEADGGVLFLDEVADLPLELQPLLFRFLDDGSYYRVGENTPRKALVRVIAATNLDVRNADRVREELYNRLAGFAVHIPPLRDRGMDCVYLAAWFVREFNRLNGTRRTLGPAPAALLRSYAYPGNVRELKFLVQRACTVSRGEFVLPALEEELAAAREAPGIDGDSGADSKPALSGEGEPPPVEEAAAGADREAREPGEKSTAAPETLRNVSQLADLDRPDFSIREARRTFEDLLRRRALEITGGRIRAAARLLSESPTGIQRMLRRGDTDNRNSKDTTAEEES